MDAEPHFHEWNHSLIEGLQAIPIDYLLCQCIVGSHLNAYRLKAVHDVDICVVLEHLDRDSLLNLHDRFNQLAAILSSETVNVCVEQRSGPLKPVKLKKGQCNVQLHLLIHDLSTWEKVVYYPGCNRWLRQNRLVKGLELSSLTKAATVSTGAIQRDLIVATENIKSSTAYCRTYDLSSDPVVTSMCRVPLCTEQCIQITLHAGICGFENTTDSYIGGKELHMVAPVIRENYSELYNRCVELKHQFDEGYTITLNEATQMKREVLNMLCDLVELTNGLK